jgi:F0F1-type ATP synthase membrane subunit b/b'
MEFLLGFVIFMFFIYLAFDKWIEEQKLKRIKDSTEKINDRFDKLHAALDELEDCIKNCKIKNDMNFKKTEETLKTEVNNINKVIRENKI